MDDDDRSRSTWVTELNDNDVLLGREAVALKGEGHRRFQQLIDAHVAGYNSNRRHAAKKAIADHIKDTIRGRGGRFMRKIETMAEKADIGAPTCADAFVMVDEEAVLQKIKQALRDKSKCDQQPERCAEVGFSAASSSGKCTSTDHDLTNVVSTAEQLTYTSNSASPDPLTATADDPSASSDEVEFRSKRPRCEPPDGLQHRSPKKHPPLCHDDDSSWSPVTEVSSVPGTIVKQQQQSPPVAPSIPTVLLRTGRKNETVVKKSVGTYDKESEATAMALISLHARGCARGSREEGGSSATNHPEKAEKAMSDDHPREH